MKFILVPLLAVVVCQLIKLVIAFFRNRTFSLKRFVWEEFWVGKLPSAHSAAIASSFYMLFEYSQDRSVLGFALVLSLLLIYSMLEDKKGEQILERYFFRSKDQQLKNIVIDKSLYDFHGHTLIEVVVGIFIGITSAIIISTFIS